MVSTYAEYSGRRQFGILVTLSLFVLIFLGDETWAKWWPYSEKLFQSFRVDLGPTIPSLIRLPKLGRDPVCMRVGSFCTPM